MNQPSCNIPALFGPSDPAPVEWVNAESDAPLLLVCEHAGRAIPQGLANLALPEGVVDTHRGWDIGARALAIEIAQRLNAPLLLQRYSRLVLDCNRPPDSADAIPLSSDGIAIPANSNLDTYQRAVRKVAIFDPYNAAIEQGLNMHTRLGAFSIHSFTPVLDGHERPWHAGFLSRRDSVTAQGLLQFVSERAMQKTVAINQPYQIEDETDWFIPAHVEPRDLRHALIEVRNDQLQSAEYICAWATLLAGAIKAVLEF